MRNREQEIDRLAGIMSDVVHDRPWEEFKTISPVTAAIEIKRATAIVDSNKHSAPKSDYEQTDEHGRSLTYWGGLKEKSSQNSAFPKTPVAYISEVDVNGRVVSVTIQSREKSSIKGHFHLGEKHGYFCDGGDNCPTKTSE